LLFLYPPDILASKADKVQYAFFDTLCVKFIPGAMVLF